MHRFKIALALAFGLVLGAGEAQAQCSGQFPANTFCGNNTGSTALPGPKVLTPGSLQPIAGGTVIGNPTGATAVPVATAIPVLGIPGSVQGSVGFAGIISGTATLRAQTVAGTPTLLLPNTSGTLPSTAVAPLALNATTGAMSITGLTGGVLWGNGPVFTTTPILGASGTIGSIGFGNSTSGTVTITPVTGALGIQTINLPNTSGTFAVSASSPLVLGALTGALSCPTCVTSSGGGAITGTAPINVSAAGVVSLATPLALQYGGTAANLTAANGGIVYSTASAMAILGPTATARQMLQSGASTTPAWSTTTWPATSTANQILYSSSANTVGEIATANNGVLVTSAGGVPSIGSALPNAVQDNITRLGTVTSGTWNASIIGLSFGGTNAALTASNGGLVYSTGSALAILSGTATAGQIPLSGASSAPSWSTATYPATASAGTLLAASSANVVAATATPILGVNGGTGGQITLNGSTSGSAIIKVAAVAGTTTFQLPVGNGANGQVLSTDGTGVTSWIAASGTGTVTNVATAGILTGGPITTTGTLNVNATISPQHRITLNTGTPVMQVSYTAQTTVFVTPATGNLIPIYNGTTFTPTAFAETSQATTDTTKSPAAVAVNSVYDIFCWVDSGTNRCTRGAAWSGATTRTTGLVFVNGIGLNADPITNGPAAQRGTWMGTIASNGSSTIDFTFGGSSSGGTAARLMVWNAYNRVRIGTTVTDSAAFTYATGAPPVQFHSSAGMQVGFLLGAQEDSVQFNYSTEIALVSVNGAFTITGVGFNTTSAFSLARARIQNNAASALVMPAGQGGGWNAGIGTNILSLNQQGDGSNANQFNNTAGAYLYASIRM